MKKFIISIILVIMIFPILAACHHSDNNIEVPSENQLLIAENATPTSGTPGDYSPLDNLAFAAYKFNRADNWQTVYTGKVKAIGVEQRVENKRIYDGSSLFAQAISVSSAKTVAEQKYYKGDNILYRPYVKIDSKTLNTTWSSNIAKLSTEDYFNNYGLIPNEIFKYVMDKNTIVSGEKISSDGNNYAYKFVLSTDSAKYFKNEVRTMAGAKSNPEFLSIECTIEIDKDWNIIKTTSSEKYKIAIFGNITCTSTSTEVFTLNTNVQIPDKSIFEAYVPNDGDIAEQPKQPIDYLTLAFNNLIDDGKINLKADINDTNILLNFDINKGLFDLKIGETIIKSTGDYIYLLGKNKVKFDTLSIFEALSIVLNRVSQSNFSVLSDAPETEKLIQEILAIATGKETEDSEMILNRILDGMQMDPSGTAFKIDFSLDEASFEIDLTIENDKLASIVGLIKLQDKVINITISPSSEKIVADESGASEISELIEALGATIEKGYISLESGDLLLTANLDGTIYLNSPYFDAMLKDQNVKLDLMGKKLSFDASDLSLPNLDIMGIIKSAMSDAFDAEIITNENMLKIIFAVEQNDIGITLKTINKELEISLTVGDMEFLSSDKVASFDEIGDFVKADNLIKYAKATIDKSRIDLNLKAKVEDYNPNIDLSLDFTNKSLVAKIDDTTLQATDALYIFNDSFEGKISFDCLKSIFPDSDFNTEDLDVKQLLEDIINGSTFNNDGDNLVINYVGKLGSADIDLIATITDKLEVNGSLTIDSKSYIFAISDSNEQITPLPTANCVLLDSLVKYAKATIDKGRIDLNLKAKVEEYNPDIDLSLDFTNKSLVAKIGDTTLQATDALYIFNDNLIRNGKISFDCLKSLLPDYDFDMENIDLTSILTDILENSVFSNSGDKLIINYTGKIGSSDIELNANIGENLKVTGTIKIDDNTYSFDITDNSVPLASIDKPDFVLLDPVIYFGMDLLSNNPTFEVNLSSDTLNLKALIKPDITNQTMTIKMGNTNIYASDKLYLENLNGKYSLDYDNLAYILQKFEISTVPDFNDDNLFDNISDLLGRLDFSPDFDDSDYLRLTLDLDTVFITVLFDYRTNYFHSARAEFESFDIKVTLSNETLNMPDSFDDYEPIDFALEIIEPIQNLISEKQFTLTLTDLIIDGESPLTINGVVSINVEEELEIDLDITFTSDEDTHNIKAQIRDNNFIAVYNDKLKINISKEMFIKILFEVMDVVGIHSAALEEYRPEGQQELKCEIISSAVYDKIPQSLKKALESLDSVNGKNGGIMEGMDVIDLIESFEISGGDGKITVTLNNESPISLTIFYNEEDITGIEINSEKISGNIDIDFTALPVELTEYKYDYDLNSLPELIEYVINTVNLGEYNLTGNINLNMIGLINVDIPFVIKVKLIDNKDPIVYLKLQVPYKLALLDKADSYLFFFNDMIYLKSERYTSRGILSYTHTYKETLYLKQTPSEFLENIIDDLFFLVPLSSSIQNTILNSIQSGKGEDEENKIDYTEVLKNYSFDGDRLDLTLGITELTGDDALGDLNLGLISGTDYKGNRIFNKFEITMKLAFIVNLKVTANLNDFDGKIEFGVNSETEKNNTLITEMSENMAEFIDAHPQWQS